jgi:cobalt-zinc-cadmium efflux system membrane fusion protein
MNRLSLPLVLALLCAACGSDQTPAQPQAAAAAPSAPGTVQMDAAARAAAGIRLVAAAPAAIEESLSLYGSIVPDPERMRRVSARYPGLARSVDKALGDTVRAGERLLTAEANDSLSVYAISAPIAGRVIARDINPGEALEGRTLFVIADTSRVWAELSVFHRDAARVRLGQTVRIRPAEGGEAVEARIDYLAPQPDSAQQSLRARVVLDNADQRWTPGLFVVADCIVARGDAALTVPAEALQELDGKATLFVEQDGGFAARTVKIGRRDASRIEVLEGLRDGERVVAGNSFLLKSELLSREE